MRERGVMINESDLVLLYILVVFLSSFKLAVPSTPNFRASIQLQQLGSLSPKQLEHVNLLFPFSSERIRARSNLDIS